jgi:hypothetical protein
MSKALLVAIAALLLAPDAHAAEQRCAPSNTRHTVISRQPGITIAAQTCVIRFSAVGRVKSWVHVTWRRTSFKTRFRVFTISSRLELRDIPDRAKSTKCRIPDLVNRTRVGSHTCESLLELTQAHGWTGDGAVGWKVPGRAGVVRGLTGSPSV